MYSKSKFSNSAHYNFAITPVSHSMLTSESVLCCIVAVDAVTLSLPEIQMAQPLARPKEEKGPSEPDELVVVPHGLHGEPGALLVVGEERRNRGIPRELLGLLTNQGKTGWQETEEESRRTAKIVMLKATLLNRNEYRFVYIYQELKPATYQHRLTCSNGNI